MVHCGQLRAECLGEAVLVVLGEFALLVIVLDYETVDYIGIHTCEACLLKLLLEH